MNAKSIRAGAEGSDTEGLEKGLADVNELIQATEKFKLEHAGKKRVMNTRLFTVGQWSIAIQSQAFFRSSKMLDIDHFFRSDEA